MGSEWPRLAVKNRFHRGGCLLLHIRQHMALQIERDGDLTDRAHFRERMIERTLTLFQSIPRDDLDYLLEKLDAAEVRPGGRIDAQDTARRIEKRGRNGRLLERGEGEALHL